MSDVISDEANCGMCIALPISGGTGLWAEQISNILDGKINLQVSANTLNEYSIAYMVKKMEEVFEE